MFTRVCVPEGRVPDLRLFILSKVDEFGVTTILKIGHTVVVPTMFIVTQQGPVGISRQGRLTGSRESQK